MSFDKQFIPLWVVMAFMILVSIAQEVKASDENGEAFCMAKNIYFEANFLLVFNQS